jgi:hypothetical protein
VERHFGFVDAFGFRSSGVTVWLPEDTPPNANRDIIGDVRGSVPADVDVRVARYSRWRRKRSG